VRGSDVKNREVIVDVTAVVQSTDEVFVEYDAQTTADGSQVEIRRTVWRKAYRQKDRDILHQQLVALLTRDETEVLIRDLVGCLAVR
jgi:hypothetical protein